MPALALMFFSSCAAQISNAKTEIIHIYGNCGMCKKTIEKAAFQKGEAKAEWNEDSKMAEITFDTKKTTSDAILKRIAEVGYDSEKYRADDAVYAKLHGCCQYERPKTMAETTGDVQPSVQTAEVLAPATPPTPTPAKPEMTKKTAVTMVEKREKSTENPLFDVYSCYFELKDALITSDGNVSAAKAKALFKSIHAVKMDDLATDAKAAWLKFQPKLSLDVEQIKDTTEIEHQREHFATLSTNMYALMKVAKPETEVFYDHCPMYNEGKGGNWLSKEEAIKNPFYGSSMLTCGKITEKVN
jgi:copper chaperone CopZ